MSIFNAHAFLFILLTPICEGDFILKGSNNNAALGMENTDIRPVDLDSEECQVYDANLVQSNSLGDGTQCTCGQNSALDQMTMKSKLNGRGESLPSGVHWWKRPKSSKHQGRAVMTLSPYTILPDSKGKTYGEGNQASGKHYPIFPQAISG
ncbi:hypothetical protein RRG08_029838 [Elysia crispata]|uniref:Uncharacterized protein n=1 Tax=Elysia crispata TaxID=231223 RepID=A0AAE1DK94_9GAST|nr:hypothetical protein RRG08_029838 [Elysia crispata]